MMAQIASDLHILGIKFNTTQPKIIYIGLNTMDVVAIKEYK